MVVSVGGAWLTVHLLLLLWGQPPVQSLALTSSLAANVTANVSEGQRPAPGSAGESWQESEGNRYDMMFGDDDKGMVASKSARKSFHTEDLQVGCRELRAKRYISDGFCTSVKPLREVVCAGHCLPIRDLPWYAEFVEMWTKSRLMEWQCVDAVVRRKAVNLLCRNGEYRTYRIKVVKACKCERTVGKRNRTGPSKRKKSKRRKGGKKKRRRGGKKRKPAEEVQKSGGDGGKKERQEGGKKGESARDRQGEREREGERHTGSDSTPASPHLSGGRDKQRDGSDGL